MRITEFEEKNRLFATQGFGAKYLLNGKWVETGALGNYNCISFNGNNVVLTEADLIQRGQGAELMHECNEIAA